MLASFIIIYILVRVNLDPRQAPLPERGPHETDGMHKGALFGGFLSIMGASASGILLLRALFFLVTGQSVLDEGEDPISLGMPYHLPYLGAWLAGFLVLALFVFGRKRSALGWKYGKGLVAPFTIIGVVLGSLYGGITGITEAAGMGALAVFLISVIMDRSWDGWKALFRDNLG